jgi:hypothetical protein
MVAEGIPGYLFSLIHASENTPAGLNTKAEIASSRILRVVLINALKL